MNIIILPDQKWRWVAAEKSFKESILVQFLSNGTVRWNKKVQKRGYWELIQNRNILKISTPILRTELLLEFNREERKAVELGNPEPGILWGEFLTRYFVK